MLHNEDQYYILCVLDENMGLIGTSPELQLWPMVFMKDSLAPISIGKDEEWRFKIGPKEERDKVMTNCALDVDNDPDAVYFRIMKVEDFHLKRAENLAKRELEELIN